MNSQIVVVFILLVVEQIGDEVYFDYALETLGEFRCLHIFEEHVQSYHRHHLARMLVVLVRSSLLIVVNAHFLWCIEVNTSHWYLQVLCYLQVEISKLSLWVRVVNDHTFAFFQELRSHFSTLFLCFVFVVVDSYVVFEESLRKG